MPITPQARDAASKKRTREKHERWIAELAKEPDHLERWAAELRAAGWTCTPPRQGLPLLPGQADPSALQDHVDRITGHPRMYPKSAAELREMARKIRAEGA